MKKFVSDRPFADHDVAARKIVEIANGVERSRKAVALVAHPRRQGDQVITIERLVSFSMAPLRPDHLALAPDTLGGGSKRDEFGNNRLGAGENASKNKVAGRSQKLIAAASIRTVPHGSVRQERRQRASNLRRRPSGSIRRQCLHCQVEAPGFSPGIFPRKHAEPGSSCGAGGHLAAASGPEASRR